VTSPIFTHLVAAFAPLVLLLVWRCVRAVSREREFIADFWRRQTLESLENARILEADALPAPLGVVEDHWAAKGTIEALSLCVEVGLFEFLQKNSDANVEQLANFIDLPVRLVQASVEMLLAAGILQFKGARYELTPAAHLYLLKKSPLFDSWLPPLAPGRRMLASIKSRLPRKTAEKWSAGKGHMQRRWAIGMHRISFPLGFALHRTGLVPDTSKVLDVAGGAGSVCIALALKNPSLHLHMLELAGSVKVAERLISQYQLSGRVQCKVADMFQEQWPGGFDVVLFTNIFHDWDDERCRMLAKKAFSTLRRGGKVILQEALLHDERPGPLWTAHFSITMALGMQGRQFRGNELVSLLREVGFSNITIHPLLGYYSVVVGVRET
jgi:O-methyltransferase domain